MVKKIEKRVWYQIFIILLILGLYGYGIGHIWGMCIYPDEFGYWSTAAKMVGWDWSQITALGSYYSFGYSLILYPILLFTSDSITAYRIALLVNAILMCIASILLDKIGKSIFKDVEENNRVFLAGIAVFYPSWIFYMQTTLSEATLMFMVVLICYLFVSMLEKAKIWKGITLAIAVGYMYTLHMRTVGILIACGLTVLIWGILESKNRKKVIIFLVTVSILLILAFYGKELIQQSVYVGTEQDLLNNNDYGGQVSKIKTLLTLNGLKSILISAAGKLVYLGFASGGLFLWGLWWSSKRSILLIQHFFKKTEECKTIEKEDLLGLFLLLVFLGTLGVNCIYTIGSTSLDNVLYGRYIEFIAPVFIYLGGCSIKKEATSLVRSMKSLFIFLIALAIGIWGVWGQESGYIRGHHSAALLLFGHQEKVIPREFVMYLGLLGIFIIVLIMWIITFSEKKRGREILLTIIVSLFLIVGLRISDPIVYQGNKNLRMDLSLINLIEEKGKLGDEIYFLYEETDNWIAFLQMQLRDKKIHVVRVDELENLEIDNSLMLTYWDSEYLEELDQMYGKKIMGDVYFLYY